MPRQRVTPDDFVRQVADTFKATKPTKRRLTQEPGDAGNQFGQKFVNPMDGVGQMISGGESGALEQVPAGTEDQVLTMVDIGAGVLKPRFADSGAHDPVTVTDSSSIDLTLTGQDITAAIVDEYVRDLVGGILVAGTNVTITVDDPLNTITIAATGGGGGLTQEQIEDFIGTTLLVAGNNVDITYNDGAGTITIDVEALTESDIASLVTDLAAKQPLDATLTDLAALAPPGADRIVFYDQSATAHAYLEAGPGLAISGTTLSADIGAGSLGQMNLPRWVTGRYYDVTSAVSASFSSGTYATGTLIAILLYVPNTNTADRIALGISGAAVAGRKARLGIYAMGSDGNPGALVIDAGEIGTDATGTVAATISQSLTGGTWYWLAVTFSNTSGSVFRAVPQGGPVGYAGLDSSGNDSFAVDRAFTYGVLPDPFGTPAIRLGHVPRIGVRAG